MKIKPYSKVFIFLLTLVLLNGLDYGVLKANDNFYLKENIDTQPLIKVLEEISEKYEVIFSYETKLLSDVNVDFKFIDGESIDSAINRLLSKTKFKYQTIGSKYFVIHENSVRGNRNVKKIKRKFKQIERLERKGALNLNSNQVKDVKRLDTAVQAIVNFKKRDIVNKKPQAATIKGVIKDALSGETLIGANVAIRGTSLGAASNLDGEYVITNIPAGIYTVRFSYIGYKNLDMENTELSPGQVLEINGVMSPEGIMGEEIVVTAQAKGQMAAINQQRASSSITNIVASDRIKEVPDVNAAESIGRLPGVSLQRSGGEGNKIVVRGLSPQYTIVEIDGVRMTGVDGDRSVGLSVISSDMLDGIELSKSLTPDKDADAIGGVVNLRTRTAEKGLHYSVLALGGYNNLETSFNNYKIAGSIGNRFMNDKFGVLLNLGQEQVIRSSDRFNAGYQKNITQTTKELYTSNATITEQIAIRERQHGSLVFDYKSDFIKIKLNNFYSRMKNDNEERNNVFRFDANDFRFQISDSQPIESIRSHSINTTIKIKNAQLNINAAYSRTELDTKRDQYNFEDDTVLGGSSISENRKLFAQPSSLIDEFFDISSSEKSILLDNVRSTSFRLDETQTYDLDYRIPYLLFDDISGFIEIGAKYSLKDRSNDTESKQAYYWGGIGIGRVNDYVNPEFPDFYTRQELGITNAEGLVGFNFDDPDYDYGEILNGRYELGWSADLNKLKSTHDLLYSKYEENMLWTQGVQSNRDDYTNREELMAGYIMAKINIGKKLMLLPGVRYENMSTTYTARYLLEDSFDPDGLKWARDVTADRSNAYWFPSVNMKYQMNEWSDLRAAVYRSASRPDYRFLSPGMTSNENRTRLTSYNPYLKPSLALNYDLGVSFYTNKMGFLTFNLFYKEIDELIYTLPRYQPEYFDRLVDAPPSLVASLQAPRALYDEDLFQETGTSNNNVPINNPNSATFSGIEVSWQTNFWYLPGLLSGLVLDLNYSMIWSQTRFPYLEITTTIDDSGPIPLPVETPVYRTRESRMIDQPASLFNARIGWDYKGFSTRLSFRYQGETIASLDPVDNLLDAVTGDLFRMDFAMKQAITDKLSFSLDIANLNEAIDNSFLEAGENIMPRSSEFFGLTAQFGLRYDF